jgi:VWFA-related protein
MKSAAVLFCLLAGGFVALDAQEGRQTFRSGVDVIQLDVSVLDRARRPVVGLKAEDFTVFENGKSQPIVSVEEADAAERDPLPSAWMRYVPRDVVANDLADDLGDGRLAAIILDDRNLPTGDVAIAMATRMVAHYLIDSLGPSDRMAVVFAQRAGNTQDFTADRARLGSAVDRFGDTGSRALELIAGGDDFSREWKVRPGFARPACLRSQPTVPTIDTVVSRLATVPGRRKTLFLISVGVPLSFGSLDPCQNDLAREMKTVYDKAKRGNVNIHTIDPTGYRGYEQYLRERAPASTRTTGMSRDRSTSVNAQKQFDFLKTTAESTGGRALIDVDPIEPELDRIFEEDRSYYLIGYVTSSSNPDGKFHKVEVKTRRRGATVRTRSGFWADSKDAILSERDDAAPASAALSLSGLSSAEGLPLRLNVLPLARAVSDADGGGPAAPSSSDEAVVLLSVRLPPVRTDVDETLTVVGNVYDADGNPGPPVQQTVTIPLRASFGEAVRYDHILRVEMPVGQGEIRVNASSSTLGKSGTVIAALEVPDFTGPDLQMSAVALGHSLEDDDTRLAALVEDVLPLVPTADREFAAGETVDAFVRVFQSVDHGAEPVTVDVRLFDATDATRYAVTAELKPEEFDTSRGAPYRVRLPLASLGRGPYLLSMNARLTKGTAVRRDVVFRVR